MTTKEDQKSLGDDEIYEKFKNRFIDFYRCYEFYFNLFGSEEKVKDINRYIPSLGSDIQRNCLRYLLICMRDFIHSSKKDDIGFRKFMEDSDKAAKQSLNDLKQEFKTIRQYINKHIAHHTANEVEPFKYKDMKSVVEKLEKLFRKIFLRRERNNIILTGTLTRPFDEFNYVIKCLKNMEHLQKSLMKSRDLLDQSPWPRTLQKMSLEEKDEALKLVFNTCFR